MTIQVKKFRSLCFGKVTPRSGGPFVDGLAHESWLLLSHEEDLGVLLSPWSEDKYVE